MGNNFSKSLYAAHWPHTLYLINFQGESNPN
jgi:hypothetical protein